MQRVLAKAFLTLFVQVVLRHQPCHMPVEQDNHVAL